MAITMGRIKFTFGAMMLIISLDGCVSVAAYQKMYLNDEDMQLGVRDIEYYDINFHSYREGAAGANGSKAGGGCGCN
jgi:hypothetical protein